MLLNRCFDTPVTDNPTRNSLPTAVEHFVNMPLELVDIQNVIPALKNRAKKRQHKEMVGIGREQGKRKKLKKLQFLRKN